MASETLLDLVWGDEALGLTATALHTAVARLRRQTSADLVVSGDLGYAVPADVSTDADVFADLVARAGANVGAGASPDKAPNAHEAIASLREGLGLWHGERAYEGVADHLVVAERTRLEDLRRKASADLCHLMLGLGERESDTAARDLAQSLLLANPLDEEAAALAMRAAYRILGQGEALDVHDTLRRALRDELGVQPGPTIRELHARVLQQDPSLDRNPTTPPGPRLVALHPGRQIPAATSLTVGRAAEVRTVLDALESGRRLVTLTGPGGVGKSRLLGEVGRALMPTVEVAHVALGAHAGLPIDDLAADVALASGLSLTGDDPVAALLATLRTSTATILVDEAEWVLGSVAELIALVLAHCPGVRLVVTSRVQLSVVGEQVIVVDPLPTADPAGPLQALREAPAVQLLTQHLVDRGDLPDADHVAEADLRMIAQVARRLDGLPLALELIAGAAGSAPLASLRDVAAHALDITSVDHGRDERHRSLREALDWGIGRLGPDARVVLRRLGVFAGPFTVAAAEAVIGDGVRDAGHAVRELARHNLIRVVREPERLSFLMLRTVRDLALDELERSEEVERTRRLHRRWFAGVWRDAALSDQLVEHVGRTHEDHMEALANALEVGDDRAAGDIALALCRRWQFVEASGIGLHWTAIVLARPGLSERQRARLEICRGAFRLEPDWSPTHHDRLSRVLVGDPEWMGMLALLGAITAYVSGDLDAARAHLDEGRRVAAAGTSLLPEIIATRAVVDAAAGETDAAVRGAHDALARIGLIRSAVHSVTVVPKVALALLDAGQPAESLDLLTAAAQDARERFGIEPTTATAVNAGWSALLVGRTDEALGWFRRSLSGPHPATAPGTVGEAACGAGCALAGSDAERAGELLGLGDFLLASSGQELPPALAAMVAEAVVSVDRTAPPPDWDVDLAIGRVGQLVRS
ncbi:ATP-binding protein [Knoellia subterranea]|uniref:ATP-binding protein n=1 Tax=Knoellia subterranea TaxID=184882 RepID=UPI001FDEE207|nr:BTAD domain-containing putative transcriptional regulator [Knoellia subterranea]